MKYFVVYADEIDSYFVPSSSWSCHFFSFGTIFGNSIYSKLWNQVLTLQIDPISERGWVKVRTYVLRIGIAEAPKIKRQNYIPVQLSWVRKIDRSNYLTTWLKFIPLEVARNCFFAFRNSLLAVFLRKSCCLNNLGSKNEVFKWGFT